VTLARRLAKLEASRTPTQVVLAWLAEAHEYPTLPEYVASPTDAPTEAWPLGRIGVQVETAVRASVKGKPKDVWQAVRRAVGDAWFLFELVLHLNLGARQIRDVEGLRWALLTKWLGLLPAEAELAERSGQGDPEHAEPEATDWRAALALSLTTLCTEQAPRAKLGQAYFEGRSVLFPALSQEWADLVARVQGLAQIADGLPALHSDGSTVCVDEIRRQAGEVADDRVRELTLIAWVEALQMLGEHERVAAIMERQVRPLLPAIDVPPYAAQGGEPVVER
jgi:hypothetical protein